MADNTKTTAFPNSIGFGRKKPEAQEGKVPLGRGRAQLGEDLSKVDAASARYGYGRSIQESSDSLEAEKPVGQFKVRLPASLQRQVQELRASQPGLSNLKLFADAFEAYKEKYPHYFK